jgi:hypothetical protein
MSSILGGRAAPPPGSPPAQSPGASTKFAAAAMPTPQPQPTAGAPSAGPGAGRVDVAAVLDRLAEATDQKLDWRKSIVDLMKLLKLDSSIDARKKLAQELSYTGDAKDSAAMNIWLHKQVMRKLAENGGKVPPELKH